MSPSLSLPRRDSGLAQLSLLTLYWNLGRKVKEAMTADRYDVGTFSPHELRNDDLGGCLEIVRAGAAVDPDSAAQELSLATLLAVARHEGVVVGVGAIKRVRRGYTAIIAERSQHPFPSVTPELGYVAVHADHQGHGLSSRITLALVAGHAGPLFATTSNPRMKATLGKAGFVQEGHDWDGQSGVLSLWIKG